MNLNKKRIIAIENCLNLYNQEFEDDFYDYLFFNLRYSKSLGKYVMDIWNFCGYERFKDSLTNQKSITNKEK